MEDLQDKGILTIISSLILINGFLILAIQNILMVFSFGSIVVGSSTILDLGGFSLVVLGLITLSIGKRSVFILRYSILISICLIWWLVITIYWRDLAGFFKEPNQSLYWYYFTDTDDATYIYWESHPKKRAYIFFLIFFANCGLSGGVFLLGYLLLQLKFKKRAILAFLYTSVNFLGAVGILIVGDSAIGIKQYFTPFIGIFLFSSLVKLNWTKLQTEKARTVSFFSQKTGQQKIVLTKED